MTLEQIVGDALDVAFAAGDHGYTVRFAEIRADTVQAVRLYAAGAAKPAIPQNIRDALTEVVGKDWYFADETPILAACEWIKRLGRDRIQPAERPKGSLTAEDVERQYRDGVHIGSGLPRATCSCGFCAKHRHGFNQGDAASTQSTQPPDAGEPVAQVESSVPHLRSIAVRIIPGAAMPAVGDQLYAAPTQSTQQPDAGDRAKYWNALRAENGNLREALRHLYHNAYKSGAEMGLALDVARAALGESK